MKVYVAAYGSGMGHASRMAVLADQLVASGGSVEFSSSGEVTRWLRERGYACHDLPLVDAVFTESGSFSATDTFRMSPVILARLLEQVQLEMANIRRFEPDVVVSDSMISTVLASRIVGVRCVAVLNQLRLFSSPKTPRAIAQLLSGTSVTLVNWIWERCDEILIPDLPPPYTISETNLWNAGSASSRARYIGFLTPRGSQGGAGDEVLDEWRSETAKRKVFWQVSGPPSTRAPFLAKALAVAKALADENLFVITAGNPARAHDPPTRVPGGYLYQWCGISSLFVDSCDVVVSRAGHVSVSDYVLRARRCLLVPIEAQTEQMGNADKARRLGFALALREGQVDPESVAKSLEELSTDVYGRRAEELAGVAKRYDAVRSVLEAVTLTG